MSAQLETSRRIATLDTGQGGTDPQGEPDSRTPAAEASRLSRRLDWRFLLPDPHLERVVYVGPRTSTLARALEVFSESVAFDDNEAEPRGEADLVVAQGANRQQVEAALARLTPGGRLYWELRPGHTLRRADLQWLERCGIHQIQTFWNWGGFENRRWIIPLDNPQGLAMLLKRRFASKARVPIEIAGRLAHSRTVRRTLAISLVACRGPERQPRSFAQRFLQERDWEGVESASTRSGHPYVVATPGFASSRSVVFLMAPTESCEPTLVAKIARVENDVNPLAREAANLRAVQLAPMAVPTVPRVVAYTVFKGHAFLLETALTGQLMQPRLVRRCEDTCIDAVMLWLLEFHTATRVPGSNCPGRVKALVEPPLAQLEPIVRHDPATGELLAKVRRLTSRLGELNVPFVFEHGDLSSPNLLLLPNGRAGVLDWELADPRGLPAVDLFFFLAFIAFARARATTPAQCVSAFRSAFFGPGAWACPYISRYAAAVGVPQAALAPLFLLCWSRYLASLPSRMTWASGRDADPDELAAVRRDRYWHLWMYAAENVDDLGHAFRS